MTEIQTIIYNFYLEVLIVCFTYAVFIMSIKNHIKFRFLKYHLIRLERKARVQKERIKKYGWIGVFIFVMVPLPVTGPVVGSVIGHMLGFSLRKNFSAVLLGTLGAIIAWVFFFDIMKEYQYIWYIIGGIIVLVLLSYIKKIIEWFSTKKKV